MKSDYQKIIRHVISTHYHSTPLEFDELFSIGYIGFRKAEKNFKPEKCVGTEYRYIAFYIRHEINTYLTKYHNGNTVSLNDAESVEEAESEKDSVERAALKEQIRQSLKKLTPKQKSVMTNMYFSGKENTFASVGRMMSLSRERVRQLHNDALICIRDNLNIKGV